ncbi:uncharacterized protein PAC_00454 [Phialocephala subalpina]|uniref:Serine hydrolase domain-containing protein n=1 Tax=Phialocephala subalpina TaxID=576137 RepID=A0A1L7WCR4_9HELO|nr:uncharacterized protein PAC_00454 [Phialocephala subalpina]
MNRIANIRSLLQSSYVFDFLDSPVQCEAAVGLKGVYPGPYYCFFERYSEEYLQKVVDFVCGVVDEDGPYDGVIGFSQGASVAAACIAQQQLRGSLKDEPFKMAVFICAALMPPQLATVDNLADTIGKFGPIDIPTAHVIGRKDPCDTQSLEVVKSSAQNATTVLLIDGGHDIPRDAVNAKNVAIGIERAFRLAFSG